MCQSGLNYELYYYTRKDLNSHKYYLCDWCYYNPSEEARHGYNTIFIAKTVTVSVRDLSPYFTENSSWREHGLVFNKRERQNLSDKPLCRSEIAAPSLQAGLQQMSGLS